MLRTSASATERRRPRWIARVSATFAIAVTLSLALPALGTLVAGSAHLAPVAAAANVRLDKPSVPVRIRIPSAGIDLPVVSSERTVPGNVNDYPLCDVAQYWTQYDLPGQPGTTWIYGHAQPGMFLPLFTISEATGGTGLIGDKVYLQLKDGRLLTYRITEVKERATGRAIARPNKANQQRLILQTSTGPPGTIPKLQAAATLIDAGRATEKAPKAKPRVCWQPRSNPTPKPGKKNGNTTPATPQPAEVIEPQEASDTMALLLGSGAVLLGATVVAVYVVRRQP